MNLVLGGNKWKFNIWFRQMVEQQPRGRTRWRARTQWTRERPLCARPTWAPRSQPSSSHGAHTALARAGLALWLGLTHVRQKKIVFNPQKQTTNTTNTIMIDTRTAALPADAQCAYTITMDAHAHSALKLRVVQHKYAAKVAAHARAVRRPKPLQASPTDPV
jgi:hypothetical protein